MEKWFCIWEISDNPKTIALFSPTIPTSKTLGDILPKNVSNLNMKLKAIKILTIIISLAVFFISLTKNTVTINYIGIKTVPSLDYFLMGSIAFLGGGTLEQIIWFANPLSLISIYLLAVNRKSAIKVSLSALFLAVSFSSWKEILGAESGTPAKIISLEMGYFLWILSIAILTIGTFIYFKIADRILNEEENALA
jgi:hypothetical protein